MLNILLKFFDKFEEYTIVILLLILTLVTFVNVVFRALGDNILWTVEFTKNMFSWLVILGASYCVREQQHIMIDAFTKRLKPSLKFPIGILSSTIALIYVGILLYGGIEAFYEEYLLDIEMEDMPIKEWIFKAALPIGFSMLFLRCLQMWFNVFKNKGHLQPPKHDNFGVN